MTVAGRCHCGNVELRFETSAPAETLQVRADTCSFCRRHGARTTSDPGGRVEITVHAADDLIRYRFALKTADFLVCARCGVYVAAVSTEGGSSYATVNINALEDPERFAQAVPVTYDGETEAERRARRAARWTPAVLRVGA